MGQYIAEKLRQWADQYETVKFIESDPIIFPHLYTDKRDIEISGFVTAWIAWGNRRQIINTASYINRDIFQGHPYEYIIRGDWGPLYHDYRTLYRTFKYSDFADICCGLRSIYMTYESMEDWVKREAENNFDGVLQLFLCAFERIKGIPRLYSIAPCKRLCLFLRWMVRRGPVDFGLWDVLTPGQLVIPLDTHVIAMTNRLQLLPNKSRFGITPTMTNAKAVTAILSTVFPNDPVRGDFALFGAGISLKGKRKDSIE